MMRAPLHSRRRGATLRDTITVVFFSVVVLAVAIPACIRSSSVNSRQNTCRSNLSNLAYAMILYDGRHGHLPGYMNALERTDRSVYVDPDTGTATPVSWAVELLTDLDRGQLYNIWREVPAAQSSPAAATTTTTSNYRAVYLELFTCPTTDNNRSDPVLNYVVNTGMPDLPAPLAAGKGKPAAPRDWQANGVFFDEFTESALVRPKPKPAADAQPLPAMAAAPTSTRRMSLSRIRDPKDRTILVTENVDAGPYSFSTAALTGATPATHEVAWGCTWSPGPIEASSHGSGSPPKMTPGEESFAPNVGIGGGKSPSVDYHYARPSSHHRGGFNVAFAGKNVQFMSDKISYFVYAKLMASDDAAVKLPGSQTLVDKQFRDYSVTDADMSVSR